MKFRLRPLLAAAGFVAVTAASSATDAHAQLRVSGEPVKATKSAAGQTALSLRQPNLTDADSAVLRLGPVSGMQIEEIQSRNTTLSQKALQVGISRKLRDEFVTTPALRWTANTDGGSVARLVVGSQEARALRVGLDVASLPEGAELRFTGSASSAVHAVSATEIRSLRRENSVYRTPLTEGPEQIIEIYLPPGISTSSVRLAVDSASHIFATPSTGFKEAKLLGDSGTCNRDVACEAQTTAFVNAKNAVAWMQFERTDGSFVCTGTLLNDGDASTQIPYFYSANHCVSTQTEASTLNTVWGYERSICNSGSAPTTNIVSGGADLLYSKATNTADNNDALLLKLRRNPPVGAYFAGWDANTITTGTALTVIHHPRGDAKKVSKGEVVGFTTLSGADSPGGNFITAGWTSGTTEGGSSGSGIFSFSDNEYFLRGGLFGGAAACSNAGNLGNASNRDYFSRFDVVFPNIRKHLAVDYTGAWGAANENGLGMSIVQGDASGSLGIVWYQYTPAPERKPVWFLLAGGWTSTNVYSGNWLQFSGSGYNETFVQSSVTSQIAGTATFTFTSPTTATLVYTLPGGVSGTKNLIKLSY